MSAVIQIVQAERDESAPFVYFSGQSADHPAAYPAPHEIDYLFRPGELDEAHLRRLSPETLRGIYRMLIAGWVPTSIGQTGSPVIRIRHDEGMADHLLAQILGAGWQGRAAA
jgi:hypothetical protein